MYEFRVIAPGLDAETIEHAEAVAQAELDAVGMTAWEAASALFKLECTEKEYDILDPNIPPRYGLTEREYEGALAWMDAEQAARKTCSSMKVACVRSLNT